MRNQLISLLFICITISIIPVCDNDDNPVDNIITHSDTSKFIGTWVTVFDTSDNPPGSKSEKIKFWCGGGTCAESDTFLFVNDTLYSGYEIGFEANYCYNEDSIYFYLPVSGTSEKVLDDVQAYYLSNDTLIYLSDSTNYCPISIRISDIPLPLRIYK